MIQFSEPLNGYVSPGPRPGRRVAFLVDAEQLTGLPRELRAVRGATRVRGPSRVADPLAFSGCAGLGDLHGKVKGSEDARAHKASRLERSEVDHGLA